MDQVDGKMRSLKTELFLAVTLTIVLVVVVSAVTMIMCWYVRETLLPETNAVMLSMEVTHPSNGVVETITNKYILNEPTAFPRVMATDGSQPEIDLNSIMVKSIESSYSLLTPKKKILYLAAGASMLAFPLLYSAIGITLCALWFYRKKLEPPILALNNATEHISAQDLDFTVSYDGTDELGRLCTSFETMRQALYENNRQMWRMLEERQTLQASVAHDLRNPIAILSGYVEYMQQTLPQGNLTGEALEHTLFNLSSTVKRMERYTDYIRDLQTIEETMINYSEVGFPDFLQNAVSALQIMAAQKGVKIKYALNAERNSVKLDKEIFFRVLENVFSNALRYAQGMIDLDFEQKGSYLQVRVTDDGPGFSAKLLAKRDSLYYSEDTTGEHTGLGLATSRILCQKHGGKIKLSNTIPHGACVEFSFLL